MQGQVSDIAIHAQEILRLRTSLNEIYVKHTGQELKVIGESVHSLSCLVATDTVQSTGLRVPHKTSTLAIQRLPPRSTEHLAGKAARLLCVCHSLHAFCVPCVFYESFQVLLILYLYSKSYRILSLLRMTSLGFAEETLERDHFKSAEEGKNFGLIDQVVHKREIEPTAES